MSEKKTPGVVTATVTVPIKYQGRSYAAGDTIEVTVAEQLAMSRVIKTGAQIQREDTAKARAVTKTKPPTKSKEQNL